MTSLKQVTEKSRQRREWPSVTSLKQAMATELWSKMADSRCRRGEGLASRGGLPLPEGRGPGVEGRTPAAGGRGPAVEGRTPAAGGERACCRGADSRCRRGEGLLSRGGLPLPEGRGPGVEGRTPAAGGERPGVEGRTPAAGGERACCRGADSRCRRGEGLLCWWQRKRKTGVCDMKVLSRRME